MALGGTLGLGLVARDARDAAALCVALCVAGVAQSHIHLRFAWQAWHKLTFRVAGVALMALSGALGRGLVARDARDARDAVAPCVAGVAQSHIHLRFAWQAWEKLTSTFVSRGRRGTHHES